MQNKCKKTKQCIRKSSIHHTTKTAKIKKAYAAHHHNVNVLSNTVKFQNKIRPCNLKLEFTIVGYFFLGTVYSKFNLFMIDSKKNVVETARYRVPSGDSGSSLSVKLFNRSNSSHRALSSKRYVSWSSVADAGYDAFEKHNTCSFNALSHSIA